MAAHIEDETLIRQALAGSRPAFSTLVKKYERYVLTLAVRFVGRQDEAEEIAQDSFLKAFRYLADFRGECKFSTWLYRIVYSTALNHLRKHRPDIQSIDDEKYPVHLPEAGTTDAIEHLDANDRKESIREAIAQLSPDDASVITLFYLHEQTIEEICHITGMTLSNAKTKLCRARQRLKNIIENQFADELR